MTAYSKKLHSWKENEAWYEVNEETGEIYLTDDAPDHAKESFALMMERKADRL